MKNTKCDRCKTPMDYEGLPIDFAGTVKRWDDDRGGLFKVDLCHDCVDDLEDWLNGKPIDIENRPDKARGRKTTVGRG